MIPANVALPLLALLTGWLALFPVRRELGPWFYHLFSFPIGILAWPLTFALSTIWGHPATPVIAVAGHALLVLVVAGLGWLTRDPEHRTQMPVWTWGACGVLASVVTVVLTRLGLSAVAFDSFMHYELSAISLTRAGLEDPLIMGARGPLVPAMQAGTHLLGGHWTYSAFTLFSLTALAALFVVFIGVTFRGIPQVWRVVASAAAVALLGLSPMWVFHSFFVHTNLVLAVYLLLSIVSLIAGAGLLEPIAPSADAAWWLVAGVCTLGVVLARPDGLAYAFVVLVLAAVIRVRELASPRALGALYAGLAVPVIVVFGSVFSRYGLWHSDKLPGLWVFGLLVCVALLAGATWLLPRLGAFSRWLALRGIAIRFVLATELLVVLPIAYLKGARFSASTGNMVRNLMYSGDWGFLWYAVFGAIVLSVLFRAASRTGEREAFVLFSLAQFFVIAFAVHGLTHAGGVGWNDSFNRVVTGAVPIAWWYFTATAAGFLATLALKGEQPSA